MGGDDDDVTDGNGSSPPVTVVLRPVGSSLGFSLGGLAIASLLTAGYELGWVPVQDGGQVGLLLLVTVVPLLALGSVFALIARDGALAGGLAIQAAAWAATGAGHVAAPAVSATSSTGLIQLAGGALIVLSGVTASRSKAVPGAAVALSGVHFVLAGIFGLGAPATWKDIAGIVSLVIVAVAGYGAWAAEAEEAAGRPVAPLGRRAAGRSAVSAHEAGVRREL